MLKNFKLSKDTVTFGAALIASAAAYSLIEDIVENNTDEPDTRLKKVGVKLGTLSLATIVAGAVSNATADVIDAGTAFYDEVSEVTKSPTHDSNQ